MRMMNSSASIESALRGSGTYPAVSNKNKQKDIVEKIEEERKVIRQLEEWKENYLSSMDNLKQQISELQEDIHTKKEEIIEMKKQIEEKKQLVVQVMKSFTLETKHQVNSIEFKNFYRLT